MQRAPGHGKRARRAAPRPFPLSRGLPALHFTPENEKLVLPLCGLADLMGRPNLVQPVVVDNIQHGLKTVQSINENKSESISRESFMSHAVLSTLVSTYEVLRKPRMDLGRVLSSSHCRDKWCRHQKVKSPAQGHSGSELGARVSSHADDARQM